MVYGGAQMSGDAVLYEQEGAVVTVTLNRPEAKNAVSPELIDGMVAACARANDDLSVGCMILTARGDTFSAGGNIKDMHAKRNVFAGSPAEIRMNYVAGVQRIPMALASLDVPIVAAVNGPAMGAGLDLALMCDLRIASEAASFGESFINLGLVSGDGGSWFLQRTIGRAAAFEMAMTGDRMGAAQALQMGLVSYMEPPGKLMPKAREVASRIARHAPHSVRLNKRLFRESAGVDLRTALEIAAAMQSIVQHTKDQAEAVAAMIEKRQPTYHGR